MCGLHALTFRFLGMSDWTSANRGLSPCQIAYRSEIAVVSLFLQNQFGLCTFYPKPLLENPSRSPKPTGFLQLQLWLHTTSNEQDDHGTTNAIFGQYATYLQEARDDHIRRAFLEQDPIAHRTAQVQADFMLKLAFSSASRQEHMARRNSPGSAC